MNEVTRIALAYAPRQLRGALTALWALDDVLGRVVASTTEPLIGQMRLTWWHDQLVALDARRAPAEPTLVGLIDVIRDYHVTGAEMATLVEGWEALLEPMPLGDHPLQAYATMRGDRLFALSAKILGSDVSTGLGAGWALTDFATRCSDRIMRDRAMALFTPVGITAPKPLRILAHVAKSRARQASDQIVMPVSRWVILRAVLS